MKFIIIVIFSFTYTQYIPSLEQLELMDYTEKVLLYEAEKKDPFKAISLNLALPLGGYAYLDNIERGFAWKALQGASYIIGTYNIYKADADPKDFNEGKYAFGVTFCAIGFVAGNIVQSIDLFIRTNKYNKELSKIIFGKIQKFENKRPSFNWNSLKIK